MHKSKRYIPDTLGIDAVGSIMRAKLGRPKRGPCLNRMLHSLPGWPRPRNLAYKAIVKLLAEATMDTHASTRDTRNALWLCAWSMRLLWERDSVKLGASSHGQFFTKVAFRDLETRELLPEEYLEKLACEAKEK